MVIKTDRTLAEAALDNLKTAPGKVAEAAGEQYNKISEEKEALTAAAEKKLYRMGATVREMACSTEEHLKQYSSELEKNIKEHPLLSVGIAALIGAFLLKLFTRNKH